MPVTILRGDVAKEVVGFADRHGAQSVITTKSSSPRFAAICERISEHKPITALSEEPFVKYDAPLDLHRFSRYWRKVEKYAFSQAERHTSQLTLI